MTTIESSEHVRVELDEQGIATLTITNAKSMNILGSAAIIGLTGALGRVRAHQDVRVLILRGSGDRAFIGGADIDELSALTPQTGEDFITRLEGLCDALRHLLQDRSLNR